MDKYEACNKLLSNVSPNIPIVWANKQTFARQYKIRTKLPIKTCLSILTEVNKSYPIIWYHTKGFVFSIDLSTKVKNSKLEVDWGRFYVLFHMDYPRDLFVVGGKFKENHYQGIHPNIYKKYGYDIYFYGCRVCINTYTQKHTLVNLIINGHLHSYLDQMIGFLRANDGGGLFERFREIAYSECQKCGDYVNKNENICNACTKQQ